MGRQRRGVVGSTNLPSITHNCEARAAAHHLPRQPPSSGDIRCAAAACDKGAMDRRLRAETARQLRPARREKLKLPLLSSGSTGGTATRGGQCRTKHKLSPREAQLAEHEKAKLVLAASIDSHEAASKSYKIEHWYASPIGFGSRTSVLLAALKSRDPGGSGFITCKQLIDGLQAPNFGLEERQARALLVEFDDQLREEDAKVPYRSFVKHLQLPDERPNQPGQDPTVLHQESYINRVRAHAAQLIEQVAAAGMASSRSNSTETINGSPTERVSTVRPPLANNGPSRDAELAQNDGVDVDRLSFEFDKVRKQRRAEAKSQVLLAHINRIQAFSQQQQTLTEQHETMRLAAKALHRHTHFEQVFEEENRRLLIALRQPKGMLGSPIAKMQHNASKDSMFYVDPV
ncbi:hypothetical protein PHYPSEUDO_006210 [Phytophthora pseudosyringae]|uniref:Uncharacterized protein n=1 Tax=Phytophthora pseudosyringae TaxID=221518 RepID=A0A8T1VPK3_9STRA|nr:hypothetical protein PHYPSEUDO_006210 [Phytophthora pseudosyringae]